MQSPIEELEKRYPYFNLLLDAIIFRMQSFPTVERSVSLEFQVRRQY